MAVCQLQQFSFDRFFYSLSGENKLACFLCPDTNIFTSDGITRHGRVAHIDEPSRGFREKCERHMASLVEGETRLLLERRSGYQKVSKVFNKRKNEIGRSLPYQNIIIIIINVQKPLKVAIFSLDNLIE